MDDYPGWWNRSGYGTGLGYRYGLSTWAGVYWGVDLGTWMGMGLGVG